MWYVKTRHRQKQRQLVNLTSAQFLCQKIKSFSTVTLTYITENSLWYLHISHISLAIASVLGWPSFCASSLHHVWLAEYDFLLPFAAQWGPYWYWDDWSPRQLNFPTIVVTHFQGMSDLWGMGIYGDWFSPINPNGDLWGWMGIYGDL